LNLLRKQLLHPVADRNFSFSSYSTFLDVLSELDITSKYDTPLKSGILIHRKFSNLPLPLVSPLHQNLVQDIYWAKSKSKEKQEKADDSSNDIELVNNWKDFSTLILIAPCELLSTSDSGFKLKEKIKSDGDIVEYNKQAEESVIFDYFEDEILYNAIDKTTYPTFIINSKLFSKLVLVSLVSIQQYAECLEDISKLVK
jgi:hypothetical protein